MDAANDPSGGTDGGMDRFQRGEVGRDEVGFEKAGIYRADKAAICADAEPPQTLLEHAAAISAELVLFDRDCFFVLGEGAALAQQGRAHGF